MRRDADTSHAARQPRPVGRVVAPQTLSPAAADELRAVRRSEPRCVAGGRRLEAASLRGRASGELDLAQEPSVEVRTWCAGVGPSAGRLSARVFSGPTASSCFAEVGWADSARLAGVELHRSVNFVCESSVQSIVNSTWSGCAKGARAVRVRNRWHKHKRRANTPEAGRSSCEQRPLGACACVCVCVRERESE